MSKQCHIGIFYEVHNDKSPAEVITKLLPLFKEKGFKSFGAEEPVDKSMATVITDYDNGIKMFECLCKARSIQDPCVQKVLASGMYILLEGTSEQFLNFIKDEGCSYVDSVLATKELFIQLEHYNINNYFVDVPSYEREESIVIEHKKADYSIRNDYMSKQLKQLCDFGNVLFLVGVAHHNIAAMFREEGCSVHDFYVTNFPRIDEDPYERTDYLLRVDSEEGNLYRKKHFSGTVIDVYKDPTLNATAIVEQHMLNALGVVDSESNDISEL